METPSQNIVTRGVLAVWGMVTLILAISLVFLLVELASTDEGTSGTRFNSLPVAANDGHDSRTRTLTLYFANPNAVQLEIEERQVELTESTVENCKIAIEALIQGPRKQLTPILSPSTRIRGIYLLQNGELIVDFSRELEAGHIESASTEWLLFQGVVHTLMQDALFTASGKSIQSVRFLFEGAPPQSTFPAHIDITTPLVPYPSITNTAPQDPFGNA